MPGAGKPLERVGAEFSCTDTNGLLDRIDENLAVADAAGLRSVANGFDGLVCQFVGAHDLDLHLGQEVHDIFGAAIEFGMALLAPEALGLGHRDALQPDLLKCLFDFVQLERLYDSLDLFHVCLQVSYASTASPYARPVPACQQDKNACMTKENGRQSCRER